MEKYGVELELLSPHGQAAATAADRTSVRTVITRDNVPVAAFIPMSEVDKLQPPMPADKEDPLVALCGNFDNDGFVDSMSGMAETGLYLREQQRPASTKRYGGAPVAEVKPAPLPLPEVSPRTGATLRPPAMVHPPAYVDPPTEVDLPPGGVPHKAKAPPKRGK